MQGLGYRARKQYSRSSSDYRYTQAGICVDTDKVGEILDAIQAIDSQYDLYSKKALAFYHSVSIDNMYKDVIYKSL